MCRFIDDIFSVGYPLPSEVDYGMKYKITAESTEDVDYLGVHVYRHEHLLRTELYDREEEYPFHIMRYPGVIIGRLVSCLQVCSFMGDFKASALACDTASLSAWLQQENSTVCLGQVSLSILAKWRRSQASFERLV